MKKHKRWKEKNTFVIHVPTYRISVVVTWEQDIKKIVTWAKKQGVKNVSKEWQDEFVKQKETAAGLCMSLGKNNTNVFVWLCERPERTSQYGNLYHELYHAVDRIKENCSLAEEKESPAFIFEYLANECNRRLWV